LTLTGEKRWYPSEGVDLGARIHVRQRIGPGDNLITLSAKAVQIVLGGVARQLITVSGTAIDISRQPSSVDG
jgi:hypothetical protein